jgi:tRNA1(Val) A37 N6-methylase TrmN6
MSLDHAADLVKQQTPTRDAFLGGRLTVSQPVRGFRAGLDSVLLGASVAPDTQSLLDLGAGVGTAALVAMADRPELTATLVERDPNMVALAGLNIVQNSLTNRARVLELDVTGPGSARAAAGLAADHFGAVIANPPFFDPGRGTAPSARGAAARHMDDASLDAWVRTAASHAAPEGEVIFIHVASALPALLAAMGSRFGAITVLPLLPRANGPASRILVRGIKGSRAPFRLLASRAFHETGEGGDASGRQKFTPEFDAIFRGMGRLVW